MRNRLLLSAILLLAALGAFVTFAPASIIQAVIPAVVPTANRQGSTGTKFFICSGAFVSGNLVSSDSNGNCVDFGSNTAGGGLIPYSSDGGLTLTAGTYYFPFGGGGAPSTTESDTKTLVESAAAISNFGVQLSVAFGSGNSGAFTIRDNGVDTAVTCTISGASAVSCNDTTHTFNTTAGHAYTVKLVTTGTITVTPNVQMSVQFGAVSTGGGGGAAVAPPYLTVSATDYGFIETITDPPTIASMTTVNVTTATAANINSTAAILFSIPLHSGTNFQSWVKSAPSTFTFTIGERVASDMIGGFGAGIIIMDTAAAGSKLVYFGPGCCASNVPQVNICNYNSSTSFSSCPLQRTWGFWPRFFRVQRTGGNFLYSVSEDGINFVQIFSNGDTSFLSAPAFAGMTVDQENNDSALVSTLYSWSGI